jgi:hypothetical protein
MTSRVAGCSISRVLCVKFQDMLYTAARARECKGCPETAHVLCGTWASTAHPSVNFVDSLPSLIPVIQSGADNQKPGPCTQK